MPFQATHSLSDHVYAAAKADMEFRTTLATARHHIENLLSAFSLAVSQRDGQALEEVTRRVAVSLNGIEAASGKGKPLAILGWFDNIQPASVHTISNISVGFEATSICYNATFQVWDKEYQPSCIATGTYTGRLSTGPQVWRWEEHQVTLAHSLTTSQKDAMRTNTKSSRPQDTPTGAIKTPEAKPVRIERKKLEVPAV